MQVKWSTFKRLTEDNIRRYAPTSAGVYLLWVQLESEKWRCYYVGQAQDLEDRLLAHISDNERNDCIKDHVSKYINGYEYAKVAKQTDRGGVEKFLYDHFKPECNKIDPGGTPIEVNLP